jgi:hypothetical protein
VAILAEERIGLAVKQPAAGDLWRLRRCFGGLIQLLGGFGGNRGAAGLWKRRFYLVPRAEPVYLNKGSTVRLLNPTWWTDSREQPSR